MMNKLKFDKAFEGLTQRQKEVLKEILSGKTDEVIAKSKKITEVAVRKHVQRICEAFELKNLPGQQYSQRPVLIKLFTEYKPELVNSELRGVEIENKEQQSLNPHYVERPRIENNCYEEIQKPGSLLRIKAPKHMGQTWLKDRIVQYSQEKLGYKTGTLSFKLADRKILSDLDKFCRWFCAVVTKQLNLDDDKLDVNKLDSSWNNLFGCNYNTTIYFQDYLLANITSPLVLALDDVDLVFERPEIANDFCVLLRGWNDLARRGNRNSKIWQKLRLIIVHATDIYGSMDINSSPLANVGRVINLPEFTPQEVKNLADSYKLDWSDAQVSKLMDVVGGHPYLVQLALDYIKYSDPMLDELLEETSTETGIYSNYLREHLGELKKNPKLLQAFEKVLKNCDSNKSDRNNHCTLQSVEAFQLHSMGLVKLKGNHVKPSCKLYLDYFKVNLFVPRLEREAKEELKKSVVND